MKQERQNLEKFQDPVKRETARKKYRTHIGIQEIKEAWQEFIRLRKEDKQKS